MNMLKVTPIFLPTVNNQARTVRSCGYLPAEDNSLGCIFRSGTYEVNVQYCACQGDLCNGGPGAVTAAPAVVAVTAALAACLTHLL
jgi:hypothetical protein